MDDNNEEKWIVTPELYERIKKFQAYLETVQGKPLMIVGRTGVGKTLFLKIAEYFYKKNFKVNKSNIGWINCAHFGGIHSDPNIARSELFGHVKGAYTGAINNKDGLIKRYESGVLLLEEIGELPLAVQAMLLTFIETGEYRRVGGTNTEKVDKRPIIVGATNKDRFLRKDFIFRFDLFYVQPLYERREDILYYWAYKFRNILKSMSGGEVLALLTYNWPGNVREIERTGNLIKMENLYQSKIPKPKKGG